MSDLLYRTYTWIIAWWSTVQWMQVSQVSCNVFVGLERAAFDNKTVSFEEHCNQEHNMWHYLYFIVLIRVKDPTEFTGPESYVHSMIKVRYTFDWLWLYYYNITFPLDAFGISIWPPTSFKFVHLALQSKRLDTTGVVYWQMIVGRYHNHNSIVYIYILYNAYPVIWWCISCQLN